MRLRAFWAAILLVFSACDAILNLSPLETKISVPSANSVVTNASDLWVEFSKPVVKTEVEALFKIKTFSSNASGDVSWSGNRMSFRPVPDLVPGTRYAIDLDGTIHDADGKTHTVSISMPFYWMTNALPPQVVSWKLTSSATLLTDQSEPVMSDLNDTITINFSKPVDQASFDQNLTLSPSLTRSLTWSSATTVVVKPDSPWKGLTRYSWSVSTSCKDTSGIPLPSEVKRSFTTFNDTTPPTVTISRTSTSLLTSLPTAIPDTDGSSSATSLDSKNQSLLLTFSKLIDTSTLDGSYAFTPSASVTSTWYVDTSTTPNRSLLVLTSSSAFTPGASYILSFNSSLKDTIGNSISPIDLSVTTNYPEQKVNQIAFTPNDGSTTATLSTYDSTVTVPVGVTDLSGEKILQIDLTFDQGYADSDLPKLLSAITFEAYFPKGSLTNPDLKNISYNSTTKKLSLTYRGFIPTSSSTGTYSGIHNLYHFQISADSTLTSNSNGSYIVTPISLYLEPTKVIP